jgi:hypothetical protein
MFREWSHQFGEFPEIIGVMGFGKTAKRIFLSYSIPEPSRNSKGLQPLVTPQTHEEPEFLMKGEFYETFHFDIYHSFYLVECWSIC